MATIGALQPYHGNDWLRHMQPISNHDNHNDLVIVAHAARVRLRDEPFDSLSTGPNGIEGGRVPPLLETLPVWAAFSGKDIRE